MVLKIKVKYNGAGIPDDGLMKKTKPINTSKLALVRIGYGLSLSYDIITKGNGGSFEVDAKEGIGAEFFIQFII